MERTSAAKARALAMAAGMLPTWLRSRSEKRAAEREDGAEGVALVHLRVEDPDAAIGELGLERARSGRADA
jgi:hypothetical protein